MTRPWLSVIVPTYNGSLYVREALESIAAQSERNFEVLAIDDGSSDATLDILQTFSHRLPLSIIRRPHVGNWVANTNCAMQQAAGEYLCWLHQDDLWEPTRLERLRPLLLRWPEADLLFHPSWYIDSRGRCVGQLRCPPRANEAGLVSPHDLLRGLLVQNFLVSTATVFRVDAARDVGWADESLWYVADWDLWLKLAVRKPAIYSPHPLTRCRVHSASQTMSRTSAMDEVRRQYETVLARHLAIWERFNPHDSVVKAVAKFGVKTNLALIGHLAGRPTRWIRLTCEFLGLGPSGWRSFIHNSRIVERVISRLRARTAAKLDSGATKENPPRETLVETSRCKVQ